MPYRADVTVVVSLDGTTRVLSILALPDCSYEMAKTATFCLGNFVKGHAANQKVRGHVDMI